MSDETISGTGETPTPGTPANGTPPTTSPGATPAKPATMSLEDAFAKIAELEHARINATEERDRHRKKLTAYEQKEEAERAAALSEVEKATKRAADAEQKNQHLQKQLIAKTVQIAAQAKGIINPKIAASAIEAELEYGDDGMPTNLDKALDRLVKENPYLIAAKAEPVPPEPAQTTPVQVNAPNIPAMAPGRSSIVSPNALQPGKTPRLADLLK